MPRREKLLKPIFTGKVIVLSGNMGPNPEANTHQKIAHWVGLRGGTVEKTITHMTTHLICSIIDYEKKMPVVKAAVQLKKQVKIVTWDWLEDCMHANKGKGRLLSEKTHLLTAAIARVRKGRKDKPRIEAQFRKEGIDFGELADPKLWSIYWDQTAFQHRIILTRITPAADGRFMQEKWILYLFESHAIPKLYKFGAKYLKGGRPAVYWRDQCRDKHFHEAFKDFQKFFFNKTGVHWDHRFDALNAEIAAKKDQMNEKEKQKDETEVNPRKGEVDGEKTKIKATPKNAAGLKEAARFEKNEEITNQFFRYLHPTRGKPVGLLPRGVQPPYMEMDEDEMEDMYSKANKGRDNIANGGTESIKIIDDDKTESKERNNVAGKKVNGVIVLDDKVEDGGADRHNQAVAEAEIKVIVINDD